MPTRMIREGYLGSERVAALGDFGAEALYFRLYLCVDDFGRYDARPRFVRVHAFPMHEEKAVSDSVVKRWLDTLAAARLILLYDVGGKPFLYLARFRQRLRAMKSKYPEPPGVQVEDIDAGDEDAAPAGGDPEQPPPPPPAPKGRVADRRAILDGQATDAINYLNVMAGTQYQIVDGTLKWPMARLRAGATLAQLKAVIDAKVKQANVGEFARQWLQPSTLFNDTKFAQYLGQLKMGPMEAPGQAAERDIIVRGFKDGEEGSYNLGRRVLPEGETKPTARDVALDFWASPAYRKKAEDFGCTRIGVKIPGELLVEFAVEQLRKDTPP